MDGTERRRLIEVGLSAAAAAAVAVLVAFSGVVVDRYAHPDLLSILFGAPLTKILVLERS